MPDIIEASGSPDINLFDGWRGGVYIRKALNRG